MFEFALSFVTGLLAKTTDNLADNKARNGKAKGKGLEIALGIVYGLIVGYLLSFSIEFATLILAIAAGNLAYGRIDSEGHRVALAAALTAALLIGLKPVDGPVLVSLIPFAVLDEYMNDKKDRKQAGVLGKALGLRLSLEVAALAVSVLTGNLAYFAALLTFDAGYHLAERFRIIR